MISLPKVEGFMMTEANGNNQEIITSHPEYPKEVERLAYTIRYMEDILRKSQEDLQSANTKIQESMANVEYLDSSDSFINILTNSRFFELARTQKESLEAVKQKPYFARI
ncbi:hypothetical protein U6M79_12330, partial [Cutibacterium acnes]